MIKDFSEIRHLAACYRRADLQTRLHVYARWILCPFHRILEHLPQSGDHLDVGCGHGILLTLMRRRNQTQVLKGVDISTQKIEQTGWITSRNISFEVCDIQDLKPASFDSISVVDVLYLLPSPMMLGFLSACYFALRPAGVLVIKETSQTPRWKYNLTRLQEILAVKVFKVTEGWTVAIHSTQEIVNAIIQAGFTPPVIRRIDRGYLYPHTLFISRKYE